MTILYFGGRLAAISVAALAFTLGGPGAAVAAGCAFPAAPRVIAGKSAAGVEGARLVQVWDLADATVYWTDIDPAGPVYATFAAGLAKHVTVTDPISLLRAAFDDGDPGLRLNNMLIARRATEWVRPVACLEKLLLADQHKRVDLSARPTGFAALVLHSPNGRRLRIYYLTDNRDSVASLAPLTDAAMKDIRAGWRPDVLLRNHSFHPGQPDLDGVLAPTESEARFAANLAAYRLKEIWITNGVHTSRIPTAAVGLFTPPRTAGAQGAR